MGLVLGGKDCFLQRVMKDDNGTGFFMSRKNQGFKTLTAEELVLTHEIAVVSSDTLRSSDFN